MSKTALEAENRYGATFRDRSLFSPVYHGSGFTHMAWPVVLQESPLFIDMPAWGLIPHWVKSSDEAMKMRVLTLNAQGETLFDKPSFRDAAASGRCLVLSSGFFEWMQRNGQKYPHFIYAPDIPVFSMGGVYSRWHDMQTGRTLLTFSIVTTPANAFMAEIHNTKKRMPLIFTPEQEKQWIDPTLSANAVRLLIRPAQEDLLRAHTVGPLIGKPGALTNTPEVQKPFSYPAFNTLF